MRDLPDRWIESAREDFSSGGRTHELGVTHHNPASNDSRYGPTSAGASVPRAQVGLGMEGVLIDLPCRSRVDERDIGVCAGSQNALASETVERGGSF